MKLFLTTVFVFLLASLQSAQMAMFPVVVLADRVVIGGSQYMPRRPDLAGSKIILSGQTYTIADGDVFSYVEVQSGGLLKADRTKSTSWKATTIAVLPGGTFDEGTVASPIPDGITYTRLIRDVPIDTTKDPFQWGNGVVNFGTHTAQGVSKTPFVTLAADAKAGDQTVTLTAVPTGWKVGDKVLLPSGDLWVLQFHQAPTREAPMTIASISGVTVGLSKPLDFAHTTLVRPDQNSTPVKHPIIANLTRNVVFGSENPFGNRGHQVDIGDSACWDIENTNTTGMGRTTATPVDNTSSDGVTHIGTNVNAKYAVHFHHVTTACPTPRNFIGNVVQGVGNGKWGVDIHGTHDTNVTDNIVMDFPGAGIITEDGYEVRNHILRNLTAYNLNPATDGTHTDAVNDIGQNCPGCEGSGMWLHSQMQDIRDNELWDNTTAISIVSLQFTVPGFYPSVPGIMPDVPFGGGFGSPTFLPPVAISGNSFVSAGMSCLEIWALKRSPLDTNIFANCYVGVNAESGVDNEMWFRTNNVWTNSYPPGAPPLPLDNLYNSGRCVQISSGYAESFEIDGGYMGGCAYGVVGISSSGMIFSNVVMQAVVDVNFDHGAPPGTVFNHVTFVRYGQQPPRFLMAFTTQLIYDGTGTNPYDGNPPLPIWTTIPGVYQQSNQTPPQFRFCADATMPATCKPEPAAP